MEQEYNWNAILYGAVPASVIVAFVFFSNMTRGWKFFYLVPLLFVAAGITYYFDKKKHNIFTSPFIVLIAALVIQGLKGLGLF